MNAKPEKVEEKCAIKNLDDETIVQATINPEEIRYEKNVPWQRHKRSSRSDPVLEFPGPEPATLSLELILDTGDDQISVYEEHVRKLQAMTLFPKNVRVQEKKHPPLCLFTWGENFPAFKGVIESLSIRYTQFLPDGTPLRAICAVTMKEAVRARAKLR